MKFCGFSISFAFTLLSCLPAKKSTLKDTAPDICRNYRPIADSTPIRVDVLRSDAQTISLRFKVEGFNASCINIQGSPYAKISIDQASVTEEKGFPELPRISLNLLIPEEARPVLKIKKTKTSTKALGKISPSKGPIMRDKNPEDIPYVFSDFYQGDQEYPKDVVKINSPFYLRAMRGVNLEFFPIKYNPALEQSTLVEEIELDIDLGGSLGLRDTLTTPENKFVDPAFISIYQRHFKNFDEMMGFNTFDIAPEHFIAEQGKLLIIAHDSLVEPLTPFVNWKIQRGYSTKVLTMSQVGPTYSDIEKKIKEAYDADKISYVVLVGDANLVPFHPGEHGNAKGNEADPMYSLVAGDDSYPDLFVSRISVQNIEELENIVTKIINYERSPTEPDGQWYRKATGIASSQAGGSDPLKDFERADLIANLLLPYGYTSVDKVYDPGATVTQLAEFINEGRGFINYTGHGSSSSWGTTGFSISDIDNLHNGNKLPFIVSVACYNGEFKGEEDGFAEYWLKAGSKTEPKGAIAMFASSTSQSWVPPTIGQKEIVNILVKGQATTIGGLFVNGVVAVLENNSDTALQTFETWHTFGDATMEVRTTPPLPIEVTIPSQVSCTQDNLTLNVKEAGISAGLVQNNELIGRAISEKDGQLVIKIIKPLTQGSAKLTLSGYNKIPVVQEVTIN